MPVTLDITDHSSIVRTANLVREFVQAVGKGVKRRIWLSKFLPDRLRDQLVCKRLGLSMYQ